MKHTLQTCGEWQRQLGKQGVQMNVSKLVSTGGLLATALHSWPPFGGPQGLASVPVEEKFEDGGEGEDWNRCAHPLLLPGSPLPSLPSADTNPNSSGTWHRLLCHTIL